MVGVPREGEKSQSGGRHLLAEFVLAGHSQTPTLEEKPPKEALNQTVAAGTAAGVTFQDSRSL